MDVQNLLIFYKPDNTIEQLKQKIYMMLNKSIEYLILFYRNECLNDMKKRLFEYYIYDGAQLYLLILEP